MCGGARGEETLVNPHTSQETSRQRARLYNDVKGNPREIYRKLLSSVAHHFS